MSNEDILDKLSNPNVRCIYGYMFGNPFIETSNGKVRDKVIRIPKSDIIVRPHAQALMYVWGYPGPDYNKYKFSDYGVTWAFSKKEIRQISKSEWEMYMHDSMGR